MTVTNPDDIRASGVLLHITSLPGPYGIGDFGQAAYDFVDWLVSAQQGLWQVLPLVPPGYGESPYQGYSAFAGNPYLVSLETLAAEGWLSKGTLTASATKESSRADFEVPLALRRRALEEAFATFEKKATNTEQAKLVTFHETNSWWLDDYALFIALKEAHGGVTWTEWPAALVHREGKAVNAVKKKLAKEIRFQIFVQYQFFRQWQVLKSYANDRGIRIIGDIPIFVAHDSADVWANQKLFHLDRDGRSTVIAGVPPDYFSSTGQRWGNPLYRWDVMQQTDYSWWMWRLARAGRLFDYVRLDHFRGFEAYWEIPAESPDAVKGKWIKGPGEDFFKVVQERLGGLQLIAEDLGLITPEVQQLRDQFHLPGMRVFQFGFGDDASTTFHQPHNFIRDCIVYSGTHDNDTTVGWFNSQAGEGSTRTAADIERERNYVLRYLGGKADEIHWQVIRQMTASVARFSVVPMQDVLGLGSESRMNLPGSSVGNWQWRMTKDQLKKRDAERLNVMAQTYERVMFPPTNGI